ncbi:helix-turn-helix domain-containing protein [Streptomyces rubiginosohelvolus]|uniref:helix-turn-helix domain-containing protein n=1 Tax=Streptomyces rubiginosohelvolus TaxID=67362 RepID=UPI0037AE9A30
MPERIIGPAGSVAAKNVRRIRELRGLTKKALAERTGAAGCPIPPLGISRIEKGERRIDVDDLLALAQALQVPYAQLVEPPPPCTSCHGAPPIGFMPRLRGHC